MLRLHNVLLTLCLLFGACSQPRPATDITLPALFSDHMVLQREQTIPVWGWASPNGRLTVSIEGQSVETIVASDSAWSVQLFPLPAGGPYSMTVAGADTITFEEVLSGEVWLASGQSNMEWPLFSVNRADEEVASAVYPHLRLFTVQRNTSAYPLNSVDSEGWAVSTPETAASFSAVAYFFGRKLHEELQLPVGLIHSSWGGTLAEAWTSGATLKTIPYFREPVAVLEREAEAGVSLQETMNRQQAEWTQAVVASDIGYEDGVPVWANPDFMSFVETMTLPSLWENEALPSFDGIVWFRKEFDLPAAWADRDLSLHVGMIDDNDSTWVNGTLVGGMGGYNVPRVYTVSSDVTRPGKNVIVIRVLDTGGGGGVWGEADLLKVVPADGEGFTPLSLAGEWGYRPSTDIGSMALPSVTNPANYPTALYNAMIHPLIPYAIRGAIWYQGEANVDRAYQYRTLFPAMIQDWWSKWNQGDFPFLFVQLANYGERLSDPIQEHPWADLREAQLRTLYMPNTGMAVTIDIGEAGDIHPRNKQDVGLRLALPALANVYGQDVVYSGPIYNEMEIDGGSVRLYFDHIGGGLVTRGGALQGFAIAGADHVFVHARARIEEDYIVVSSPNVAEPIAVRYAWAFNPRANLYNAEGLPASPFRTDDWPGVTER